MGIEVDFGSFSEGRPVSRAAYRPVDPAPDPEPQEEQPEQPPEVVQPVDLPETIEVPETTDPVEDTEDPDQSVAVAPPEPESVDEVEETEAETPIRPLGAGDPEGDSEEGLGEEGTSNEETARAPFQIEGLNRVAVQTIVPRYTAQENAVISVRITVGPTGRIVSRFLLRKGSPQLEQAVMNALLNWRFNPLPPNAPQENQTGVVTFRFQLR